MLKRVLIKRSCALKNLTIKGSWRPSTVDVENRTVEVLFTTGEGVRRYDWEEGRYFVEELRVDPQSVRSGRLDKGLSVIDHHNVYNGIRGVFGITEDYRFTDEGLLGTVRFGKDDDSDAVFNKVSDGILRHVSLGYKVHEYRSSVSDSSIPTYVAVDWEPLELSFTPVGAETMNGVRSDPRNETKGHSITNERDNMDGDEVKKDDVKSDDEPSAKVDRRDDGLSGEVADTENKAAEKKAREDLSNMGTIARSVGLPSSFAETAFAEGVSVPDFRTMVINKLGEMSSSRKVVLNSDHRSDARDTRLKDVESSLLLRSSVSMVDTSKIERTEGVRSYEGVNLLTLARLVLEDSGVRARGMSPQKVAERAFQTDSDLPLIFENVMNKGLQAAFTETPRTFTGLGRRVTVNDFRDKNMYSVGDAPSLLPIGDNGEYKSGKFSEGKERYAISTYARKIAFTRQMMINDDMSALDMLPASFGAAGSRLESDIVWGLILNYDFLKGEAASVVMADGNPLFHSSHKNFLSGAGSDVSLTGLSNLRKLGRKQKTLDGNHMNVEFETLVFPSDLETAAEQILVNSFTAVTAGTTNSFSRKMKVVVEPRLDVVSTVEWYAFANHLLVPTFEYAYLSGEEDMMVEVSNSVDIDGMVIKVRKDFGAGLPETRGMAKAAGVPSA